MTRPRPSMVLIAAASILLAACGSDGEPSVSDVDRTTVATTVETTAPTEDVTEATTDEASEEPTGEATEEAVPPLVVWADDIRVGPLRSIAAAYTEATGTDVVVEAVPFGEMRDRVRQSGSDGPDVFVGAHEWTGELATDGLVAPVDVSVTADRFIPVTLDGFNFEGRNYAIPFFAEAMAMFRNTDLVAEAPTTWDDLTAACDRRAVANCLVVAGGGDVSDAYHTYPFGVSSMGGYIFGFDESTGFDVGQVGLDSAEALASGAFLERQVDGGYISSTTSGAAKDLWLAGEAAFWATDPAELDAVRNQTNLANWDVSVIPVIGAEPAQPLVVATGMFVSASSERATEATTFLLAHVATDEAMQLLYEADPRGTAWASVQASIDPQAAAFGESVANGAPIPNVPQMAEVWEPLGESLLAIRNGEVSADEALSSAAETVRASLAG